MLPIALAGTTCALGFASKNFYEGFQVFVKDYFRNQSIYNSASLVLFTTSTILWANILNIKFINPYAFNIYPSCRAMADISRSLRGEVENDYTDLKRAHGQVVYYLVITLVAVTVIANLYATFREAKLV